MEIVVTSRHTFSGPSARAERSTILLRVGTAFVVLGAMAASRAMAQSQPDLGKGPHVAYARAGNSSLRLAGSAQPSGNIRLSPGFSWQESFSGPAWVFEDIAFAASQTFPDPQHGWVAGGEISPVVQGWVHRTQDGGLTWSGRIVETPFPIRAILFLDRRGRHLDPRSGHRR